MSSAPRSLEGEGGRSAQVLHPCHRWLTSFGALAAKVRASWDADTAWIDDWDPRNPARGQCGTSALALQDERGGKLVRGVVDEASALGAHAVHYWNVFDGRHADLTWQQFPPWARVVQRELITRDDLLENPWFTDRYLALRSRLDVEFTDEAATAAADLQPSYEHWTASPGDWRNERVG